MGESECGMLIKQISDSIARLSNNELRKNGLTLSQLRYMGYIYEKDGTPVPFKELESHFEVSQPTVAGILRRLEEKKLITTNISGAGGKAKAVLLTKKGSTKYENSEIRRNEMEEMLLSPLNEREKREFQKILIKVCAEIRNKNAGT